MHTFFKKKAFISFYVDIAASQSIMLYFYEISVLVDKDCLLEKDVGVVNNIVYLQVEVQLSDALNRIIKMLTHQSATH